MGAVRRAGARSSRSRLGLSGPSKLAAPFAHEVRRGSAAELVALARGEVPSGRLALFEEVTDRAVVLGSTQPAEAVDEAEAARLAAAVVRRPSGGGAVFVAPGAQVWVDFFLPAGDPLLVSDLSRSFEWLGGIWARALSSLGVSEPVVTGSSPSHRPLERTLCFAGIGAGEVVVGGRKVVGISQRRGREGAYFFSMLLLEDTSPQLISCLRLSPAEKAAAGRALASSSAALQLERSEVRTALLAALG